MTNWIVSHNNRFKAAVTLRSLSNLISDEGTRWQPYGHEEYYEQVFSSMTSTSIGKRLPSNTPEMSIRPRWYFHSDMDFQLPLEQGEQWFRALKHYGVPSELVIFPRENHNLTRTGEPQHLVESLNWQIYWFDRYLNGNAKATPPDK